MTDYSRYQFDPGLLSEFATTGRPALIDFIQQQSEFGGKPRRGVEDLFTRLLEGQLKAYSVPENIYPEVYGSDDWESSGGFHRGDEIYMRDNPLGLGHELGHEFFGHKAGTTSVPQLNPYEKVDRKLKGWLPSFNKYSDRPSWSKPIEEKPRGEGYYNFTDRDAYNKRMLASEYHPKFADAPFDALQESIWNLQSQRTKDALLSNPIDLEETRGGDYNIYDKRSLKAKDFRYSFRDARRAGLDEFEWDGMSYSTELA